MTTTASLITNNAYDGLVITDANGSRLFRFANGSDFSEALAVGDDQYLDNWSGESLDDGVTAADCGDVIAINDGIALTVLDADKLADRLAFWRA